MKTSTQKPATATITSPQAPQELTNGNNIVTGSIDLSTLSPQPPGVTLYITSLCDQHCHGTIYNELPPCGWPAQSAAQDNAMAENLAGPEMSIMPNPARPSILVEYAFQVDSSLTATPKYQLSVCDATGRQAQLVNLDGPTGKRYMDTRNWQPGIYFIEMRNGTAGVLTKRIVILK